MANKEARKAAIEDLMDRIESEPSACLFTKMRVNDGTRVSTEQLKHIFIAKETDWAGLTEQCKG